MAGLPNYEFADNAIIKTWAKSVRWLAQQRTTPTSVILDEIRDEILNQMSLTDFWEEEFGETTT